MILGGTPCGPCHQTFAVRRRRQIAVGPDTVSETRARGDVTIQTVRQRRRRSAERRSTAARRRPRRRSPAAGDARAAAASGRHGRPSAREGVAGSCSRGTGPRTGRRTPSRSVDR